MPKSKSAHLIAAVNAAEAGLCVVPPRQDGSKAPEGFWKEFQSRRPTGEELRNWYSNGRTGVGVVCGAVSGGLEMFEFEGRAVEDGVLEAFDRAAEAAGIFELVRRIMDGYCEWTPSGGIHLLYRCSETGNIKLAQRRRADNVSVTLIETKGEGGYTVIAPSDGSVHPTGGAWTLVCGGFASIETITPEERAQLHALARTFNEIVVTERPALSLPTSPPSFASDLLSDPWGASYGQVDLKALIASSVDIVQVYRRYSGKPFLNTRRRGPEIEVRCPLPDHKDCDPSASLNTEKQLWKCFGCGKEGDKFTLAAYGLGLNTKNDFHEVLRRMADDFGVDIPRPRSAAGPSLQPDAGVEVASAYVSGGQAGETSALRGELPEDFWAARPALAHIRTAAHSSACAPSAVLHAVLARVAAGVPHSIKLPAVVGTPQPLCYFAAIVDPSGSGKSIASNVAGELISLDQSKIADRLPLGSGEGLVDALFEIVTVDDPDRTGKTTKAKIQTRYNAYVYADEGQLLASYGRRDGSALLPTIRTIWTGGTIGQTNASQDRKRIARQYTYGIVVGLQESNAGALLDDVDGGTPQRFAWTRATDPGIPDEQPDWPGRLEVPWPDAHLDESAVLGADGHRIRPMTIAGEITNEIRSAHLAKARGHVRIDPLDSHANLLRLKIAGLLAILDGRLDINLGDWTLAGTIRDVSDAVRGSVRAELSRHAATMEQHTSRRLALRAVDAEAAKEQRRVVDCSRKIANKVWAEPERWTRSDLYKEMRRYRDVFDDGLERAIVEGWIIEQHERGQGEDKRVVRPGRKKAA